MTEIEARGKIKYRIATAMSLVGAGEDGKAYEDLEIALQALKQIREYREIGTVEECRENKDFLEFLYNQILPNEMEQYLSIYRAKDKVVVNGYADQNGLTSAT